MMNDPINDPMPSYELPPIHHDAEDLIPEHFLEEVVAEAVADVNTTTFPTHPSTKKRKRPQAAKKKHINEQKNASSPLKVKKKYKLPKICSVEGCTNQIQSGTNVCIRHGAPWTKKQCSVKECTRQAINGGVCRRHGAKLKLCDRDGCSKRAKLGGFCFDHSNVKRCTHYSGCCNEAKSFGLCARHGGLVGLCYHKGCINQTYWGLCQLHGGPEEEFCCLDGCSNCYTDDGDGSHYSANEDDNDYDEGEGKVRLCFHRGCINLAAAGGVCDRHSDEAYLYPVCMPCKANAEKASNNKGAKESPKTNRKKKARTNKATKEALRLTCDEADRKRDKMESSSQATEKEAVVTNNNKNASTQEFLKTSEVKHTTIPHKSSTTTQESSKNGSGKEKVMTISSYVKDTAAPDKSTTTTSAVASERSKALKVVDRNCGGKDERHCILRECYRYVMEEGGLYCKFHKDTKDTCNYARCLNIVPDRKQPAAKTREQKPRPAKRICSQEGCNNQANRNGLYCPTHKPRPAKRICNHEGCTNRANRNGKFCSSHKPKIVQKRCSIEGCTRFAKGNGVCITHGATVQRKLCCVDGCKNQAKRRRVCKKHGAYDDALFDKRLRLLSK